MYELDWTFTEFLAKVLLANNEDLMYILYVQVLCAQLCLQCKSNVRYFPC